MEFLRHFDYLTGSAKQLGYDKIIMRRAMGKLKTTTKYQTQIELKHHRTTVDTNISRAS